MTFTKLEDYTNKDYTDFKAYHNAQVANGEMCSQCGAFLFKNKGRPTLCGDCYCMENNTEEVDHSEKVRCPNCGNQMEASDEPHLCEDGEHDVWCDECDFEYRVITSISYSFESPARLEKEKS